MGRRCWPAKLRGIPHTYWASFRLFSDLQKCSFNEQSPILKQTFWLYNYFSVICDHIRNSSTILLLVTPIIKLDFRLIITLAWHEFLFWSESRCVLILPREGLSHNSCIFLNCKGGKLNYSQYSPYYLIQWTTSIYSNLHT